MAKYRLRDGGQVPTRTTTIDEIMGSPKFALGVADVRAGRGVRPDYERRWATNEQWEYERGRMWATLAPRDVPLKIAGKLNPRAVKLFMFSFSGIL